MSAVKTFSKIFFILFLLFLIGLGLTGWGLYRTFIPASADTTLHDFIVKEKDGVNQVSARLVSEGLLSTNFFFDTYLWAKKAEGELIPGVYQLSPNMSAAQIANIITGGEHSPESQITILEGWTSDEIAGYLADFYVHNSTQALDNTELRDRYIDQFLLQVKNPRQYNYPFLKDLPDDATLEGFLYPDTYRIYRQDPPAEAITKMLDNFNQKYDRALQKEVANSSLSLFEIVTLASIVDKEVENLDDMRVVAGVYLNRLHEGKKLQSDVTVNFISQKNDPTPSFADTRLDSPYNTYLYEGLPPGPVGNPSIESIKAVIYPAEHEYYYFLTRLDNGQAIFSETAEEHERNKNQYLP